MLKLRCPEGQRIKVEEARYGSDRFGTCLLLNPRPGGGDLNCTHITNVSLDCCGQQSCNVSVDKVYLPTCYRASTFLRVVYECVLGKLDILHVYFIVIYKKVFYTSIETILKVLIVHKEESMWGLLFTPPTPRLTSR